MDTRLSAVLIPCLLVIAGCGSSGGSLKSNPALTQMVETEWASYTERLPHAGGLLLYMITPQEEYLASTGIEGASPDIHFRAASNTKTFTAAAIMLLNQEGRLNIDDMITSPIPGSSEPYLPGTEDYEIPYKSEITIKQLLAHNAGVYDIANDAVPAGCPDAPYAGRHYGPYIRETDNSHTFSFDELINVVAHCRLSYFAPGTGHHYSNTGYTLLAKIIERVSGISYGDFLEQNLIQPNELFQTSAPHLGTDQTIPSPFAPGNFIMEGELYPWADDNMSENVAEGNIISTPRELGQWIRRLVNGEAGLSKSTISAMTQCISPTGPASCYGLGISHISDPVSGYGHSGAHPGYLSLMMHDPDRNITTIIFTTLLNFDALTPELNFLIRLRGKAYEVLGQRSI